MIQINTVQIIETAKHVSDYTISSTNVWISSLMIAGLIFLCFIVVLISIALIYGAWIIFSFLAHTFSERIKKNRAISELKDALEIADWINFLYSKEIKEIADTTNTTNTTNTNI